MASDLDIGDLKNRLMKAMLGWLEDNRLEEVDDADVDDMENALVVTLAEAMWALPSVRQLSPENRLRMTVDLFKLAYRQEVGNDK